MHVNLNGNNGYGNIPQTQNFKPYSILAQKTTPPKEASFYLHDMKN
jgi:hypothetical protein